MRLLLATLLAIALAGCAIHQTHGNPRLTPESIATIQKGKSTKTDVLTALGPPQSTQTKTPPSAANLPPGSPPLPAALTATEIWTYWNYATQGEAVVVPFYAKTTTSGSNTILSIYYDTQGVVQDLNVTSMRY